MPRIVAIIGTAGTWLHLGKSPDILRNHLGLTLFRQGCYRACPCIFQVFDGDTNYCSFPRGLVLVWFLVFFVCFLFVWPYHTACGILVPWPGIEPGPMAVKVPSPNHWPARNSLFCFFLFIYLFLTALGLHWCAWAFSSCVERGLLFIAVRRLLIAVASLDVEHGL